MLWCVHPQTVNLIPLGKQSWFDSKLLHQIFRCVHITVIISDCLSEDGSSTLPRIAKFMDMMCQLPDAGMKFPNSIGERSGLDSHCCPPSFVSVSKRMSCCLGFFEGPKQLKVMGSTPNHSKGWCL